MTWLFPVRPPSVELEATSSWVARLADSLGMQPGTLQRQARRACRVVRYPGDLDLDYHGNIKDWLAKHLGNAAAAAQTTNYRDLEDWLYSAATDRKRPFYRWILQFTYDDKPERAPPFQFCPHCLAEGSVGFPICWRLAWSTCCVKHGTRLIDACPHCRCPANPMRTLYLSGGKWRCRHCDRYLHEATAEAAHPEAIAFERKALEALRLGYVTEGGLRGMRSNLYFDLLHHLWRRIHIGSKATSLCRAILERLETPVPLENTSRRYETIEIASVINRHALSAMANMLITNWPDNLISICRESGMTAYWLIERSGLVTGDNPAPYALWRVAKDHLVASRHAPCQAELDNIHRYLISRGEIPTCDSIKNVSGYNGGAAKKSAQSLKRWSDLKTFDRPCKNEPPCVVLTDKQWEDVLELLPPLPENAGPNRPSIRDAVHDLLYLHLTGAPTSELPGSAAGVSRMMRYFGFAAKLRRLGKLLPLLRRCDELWQIEPPTVLWPSRFNKYETINARTLLHRPSWRAAIDQAADAASTVPLLPDLFEVAEIRIRPSRPLSRTAAAFRARHFSGGFSGPPDPSQLVLTLAASNGPRPSSA